jgi:glycerol kinase
MIFDHSGNVKGIHQLEHEQILPQAGWVEHNPTEIWSRTETVVKTALQQANLQASYLAAVGVTNQRETAVVWNRNTGQPYYNAIVWQDTRTDRIASALEREGKGERSAAGRAASATYFSVADPVDPDNVDGGRRRARLRFRHHRFVVAVAPHRRGRAGVHVTDPPTAARCSWTSHARVGRQLRLFGSRSMLPRSGPARPGRLARPAGPFSGRCRSPVTR